MKRALSLSLSVTCKPVSNSLITPTTTPPPPNVAEVALYAPLQHSPKRRQMISRTINSFLLVVPVPLLLNVDVPPFLVSGAIVFSYMYDCIQQTVYCISVEVSVSCTSLQVPENSLGTCQQV